MSRHTARSALDRLHNHPALIAPQYVGGSEIAPEVTSSGFLADIRELAAADPDHEQQAFDRRKGELCAAYGFMPDEQRKPFAFAEGAAIIPIHGLLLNRFPYSWSFVTGYNFIRNQLNAALGDDDVKRIVFDVNSYGGEAAGCMELADEIFAARAEKPSLALIDTNCYSAAYMLASSATRVVLTPSGGAGSIGVVMAHMDLTGLLDKAGVKATLIFAGDHKVDGSPYVPLTKDVKAEFQSRVDKHYDIFVRTVARNRDLDADAVRATEARCFLADDALAQGLVDAVQPPPDALRAFFEDDGGDDDTGTDGPDEPEESSGDQSMTTTTTTPPAGTTEQANGGNQPQADAGAARAAERQRIAGIQGHAEAAGRTKLAAHLALETDLSVEQAAAILAAAPKESAQPAQQQPAEKPQQTANPFKEAMDTGKHPEVGAGAGGAAAGGEQEQAGSAGILAAFRSATGIKAPAGK